MFKFLPLEQIPAIFFQTTSFSKVQWLLSVPSGIDTTGLGVLFCLFYCGVVAEGSEGLGISLER